MRTFPEGVPDTTAIANAVKDDAIESVMVVKKLTSEENTRYVPGYVSTEPVTRYNPWTRAYDMVVPELEHQHLIPPL